MKLSYLKSLVLITGIIISQQSFAELIPVNSYQCMGKNISVNYTSSSFIGQPTINITIGQNGYGAISSDSIKVQPTVAGNLISLTRNSIPDKSSDDLSVILPNANVTALGNTVTFKSQLLMTHTKTSIAGPALVNGIIENTRYFPLTCTATAVVF